MSKLSAIREASVADRGAGTRGETLSELPGFFRRIAQYDNEFIVWDNGFRGRSYSYREIGRLAGVFAARLREYGIGKGDAVMIWSESRPGWVVALWGCLINGAVAVPVEPQSSIELFRRIEEKVKPKLLLVGDRVPALNSSSPLTAWQIAEIERAAGQAEFPAAPPSADDAAEIVFTSGTTAEPKGVVITHRNLAAQLGPMEAQIAPYRKFVRPFAPLRILDLLPMSHLFGQSVATFVAPLIPASVVFLSSSSPHEIVRQIRYRRVAVLVAVPRLLELLRDFVVCRFPEAANLAGADRPWPIRWWRARAIHRMFGWKFCCVFSGGAPLPGDLERFWMNLGFVPGQGYGLTETAPIVSFTHPFHVRHGTAGMPLANVDVRIAGDGEILVRGDSVTPRYFEAPEETARAFRDGWFLTGDLGEIDAAGNLIIRGRKKDVIVTPEGLKVYPEDVENVLNRLSGVRDCAVVGTDRVHAVLALTAGADANEIVRQANAKLEAHQRIREVSVWPEDELPRTGATRKLQRVEIARRLAQGRERTQGKERAQGEAPESDLVSLVAKYAPGRAIGPGTTIEELGLGSLDRVQLMLEMEAKLDVSIDESAFAQAATVADLAQGVTEAEEPPFPKYNRGSIARLIRGLALEAALLPLAGMVARRKVSGMEILRAVRGPVVFASNHQSHLDTPIILAALPRYWRRRIAPVMWKEYFDAYFHPEGRKRSEQWANGALYFLIALLFNAFPIPQTGTGARESIRYMGELVEEGWSILIFPEGERRTGGDIGPFYPGIGMIASRLDLPVIPIRLRGVDRVLPRCARFPRPGPVEVKIGPPIHLAGESYASLARMVEEAVREL